MPSEQGEGPRALQYNRKNSVLAERRDECARCREMEDRMERQIIQNGVLRLKIMELEQEIKDSKERSRMYG